MVRGRKNSDPGVSSGWAISGHLDDWIEQAVDYVDGRADEATKTAIQEHLDGCPDCAARLASQQTMRTLFDEGSVVDPPATLEAQVLDQILHAPKTATIKSAFARRRAAQGDAARKRALPTGPWVPALAGAAAVVALVLALTISHGPVQLERTGASSDALASSDGATAQTLKNDGADELATATGEQVTANVVTDSDDSESASSTPYTLVSAASLQPVGPYVQDEELMVTELAQAEVPAYVFFDTLDGSLVTLEQADTLTTRFTSLTGLQLMDEALSSGIRTFAAYVSRDDVSAIVDLLFSLGDSMSLSVCMSLEPGAQVTAWADAMLANQYSLAELSASPLTPSGWRYTTSTATPTTESTAVTTESTVPTTESTVPTTESTAVTTTTESTAVTTESTVVEELDTRVLVVIFMAIQE